jgi:hypothetical protein
MNPRPLDLLDLPMLYRQSGEVTSLDSARMLTRGNPLGMSTYLAHFNPARHVYTAVANGGTNFPLIGSILHDEGEAFARLLYLAPTDQIAAETAPALVDHLVAQAGRWGAFHVRAEVDERSEAFRSLRQCGFSVYAWQRVWDVSDLKADPSEAWIKIHDQTLLSIQNLHHQIVPALLHPIEPYPHRALGLSCCDAAPRAYVSVTYGAAGIMLQPLIHPECEDVPAKLLGLISHLPNRGNRRVYLCVRSYQAWLEPVLEDLGAQASERQAVMVKHLARMIKDEQAVKATQPATAIPASRISGVEVKREK